VAVTKGEFNCEEKAAEHEKEQIQRRADHRDTPGSGRGHADEGGVRPAQRERSHVLQMAEQHEEWMEGSRYLNTDLLREQIKPMKANLAVAA